MLDIFKYILFLKIIFLFLLTYNYRVCFLTFCFVVYYIYLRNKKLSTFHGLVGTFFMTTTKKTKHIQNYQKINRIS